MAAIVCAVCWHWRDKATRLWQQTRTAVASPAGITPQPDPARYATLKEEAERWRTDLAGRYAKARTPAEKDKVLAETRNFLETLLPEMMLCWLGTPWNFHGTAEGPGQGNIACGYFVSTVLKDAGFRVDRYKLAQQASQNILRSFLPRESLDLQVGVSYDNYATGLNKAEHGVRIVGLDSHVAFLVTGPEGFRFIHSSGSKPWCVVNEDQAGAEVLRRSNYRVQGLLTGDKEVLRRWLGGKKIGVKGDGPATAAAGR
ncbi:hypothetical protein [Luteolibacter sp. Populi]|uniref:hypothetical protein n=1 Tax=Luteolibacter sp. Populi TaxID=3230487 RepID=UPI0034657B26